MIFYEIVLQSVPEFLFACSVSVEKYKNSFSNIKGFIELAYCNEGRIRYEHADGREEFAQAGMMIPIFEDMNAKTTAWQNELQRHSTVGVTAQYTWTRYESEEECDVLALLERMKHETVLLIPYHEPVEELAENIRAAIDKMSLLFHSGKAEDRLVALSEWFQLAALLTNFVTKKLDKTEDKLLPCERKYIETAMRSIHKRYAEKLSVQAIAHEVGISEGYLHRIFKKQTGYGITEYLNRYRVQVAIRLMESLKLSLKEAAYHVGIDDPAYMSRLFRKVTGCCFREFFTNKK